MPKVQRKNRQLTVSEEAVPSYLKNGYDLIDEKGKVIENATGGKIISLVQHNEVVAENEKLIKENEKLKKEIAQLKKAEK
ncbi:hypothetical protein CN899_08000 [Bacillus thuringiensis]|uniref:Uncharacterized protein n=1 Tax=Bacillus thuringiensis TaxID=1428 RepID=A0A9X7GKA5_BACTU|nr:hypothetical protein [Bacillus thuringiensis]PGH85773.1 hypothetical protein CN899_08000 [Bacillus thuringiensis]